MSKYLLRRLAERYLPKEIAWRKKAMFRAPFDSFHLDRMPAFVDQLLSEESIRKTGRSAQGVRIVTLDEGDAVAAACAVKEAEEEPGGDAQPELPLQ